MPDQLILDEILQKLDITAVFAEYLKFKKTGKALKALCPFHQEKTPSFTANSENGLWHCFGCGEGGNLFQFVMRMESLEFPQVLELLAQKAGIKLPQTKGEKKLLSQGEKLLEILQVAALFYQDALKSESKALSYLNERGLSPQTIEKFRLGVTPPPKDALVKHLLAQGFTKEEILRSGAGMLSSGGDFFDYLRGRLIFPLTDFKGRVLGLAGRILGTGEPKYLNTPETALFKKGNLLYALSLSRSAISKQDWAIVVEGYLDAISLYQAGFLNVVATMGTSLTLSQANLLRRFASKCLLAFDADKAGQTATGRGIEIFDAADLQIKILPLPRGEDPDSLIRKGGAESFKKLYQSARGVIEYLFAETAKKFDLSLPEEKAKFAREIAQLLSRLKDPVKRDEYIRRFCEEYKIREESFRRLLKSTPSAAVSAKKVTSSKPALTPEEEFLTALLFNREFIITAREQLKPDELISPWAKELYSILLAAPGESSFSPSLYLQELSEEKMALRLTELLLREDLTFTPEVLQELILKIKDKKLAKRKSQLLQNLPARQKAEEAMNKKLAKEKSQLFPKYREGKPLSDDEEYREIQRIKKQIEEGLF